MSIKARKVFRLREAEKSGTVLLLLLLLVCVYVCVYRQLVVSKNGRLVMLVGNTWPSGALSLSLSVSLCLSACLESSQREQLRKKEEKKKKKKKKEKTTENSAIAQVVQQNMADSSEHLVYSS